MMHRTRWRPHRLPAAPAPATHCLSCTPLAEDRPQGATSMRQRPPHCGLQVPTAPPARSRPRTREDPGTRTGGAARSSRCCTAWVLARSPWMDLDALNSASPLLETAQARAQARARTRAIRAGSVWSRVVPFPPAPAHPQRAAAPWSPAPPRPVADASARATSGRFWTGRRADVQPHLPTATQCCPRKGGARGGRSLIPRPHRGVAPRRQQACSRRDRRATRRTAEQHGAHWRALCPAVDSRGSRQLDDSLPPSLSFRCRGPVVLSPRAWKEGVVFLSARMKRSRRSSPWMRPDVETTAGRKA